MNYEVLIIDDNIKICKSLLQNFNQLGYKTHYAVNSKDAYGLLVKNPISVILLDIVLGEEDGIEVFQTLISLNNKIPIIIITGYGTIETAVKSIKMGAFDYVQKPLNFDKLLKIVENAFKMSSLTEENKNLKERLIELTQEMITQDSKMLELCVKAKRLAPTDIPILITGENGTGKELMADYIHFHSQRSSQKMMKINCIAFPESLLDNELFGHEKGAYTGASATYIGVFEKANKSTILLDEIGDMPLITQAKILRFLQNKEIKRVGGNTTILVDIRFIAATNKDLEKLVEEKKFRQDLLYRLNAAIFHMPPLRERKADIQPLLAHFLSEFARDNNKKISRVSDKVLAAFMQYNWPGNIRELKNSINYAAAISEKDFIDIEDLPSYLLSRESKGSDEPEAVNTLFDVEKKMILQTLQTHNYNIKKTAEILKISRKTLYNKLKKYGL
jgi:DNA-binding NtrC family response regulator